MKKRIMLIGPTQAGKSTLANCLNETDRPLARTQDIIYGPHTIDTPGSYIENASMYKWLIATAQTAAHVLILVDQSRPVDVYPPRFAQSFTCPVIGVITKSDLSPENADRCIRQLQSIGIAEPYFRISAKDSTSIHSLKNYLFGQKQ